MLSEDHQPDVLVVKYLACNTKNLPLQISKGYDVKVANVKEATFLFPLMISRSFLYFVSYRIKILSHSPISRKIKSVHIL